MINKAKITYIALLIFVMGFILIFFLAKNYNRHIKPQSNLIAIMLETEPGIYTKSQFDSWPSNSEYVFNSEKSYCVHGGTIIWNGNDISINSNGADKCYAYFKKIENVSGELSAKILELNGGVESIKAKGIPNFNNPATTNEGMFATQDDHGTSYYFRGAVDNNWVYFGGFYWRIVRINGDGSVKMIYTGSEAPTSDEATVMTGVKTHIGTEHFNSNNENAEAMGYMYSLEEHRGYSTNSGVKSYIDTWYQNNLSYFNDYLSDFIVCNDRGFTQSNWVPIGLPDNLTFSDAYKRLETYKSPQLLCAHEDDAFTVSTEAKGNGRLTYPIGLLTADEVWMAGGHNSHANKSDYLYSNTIYWLSTPQFANDYTTMMFIRYSSGEIYQSSPSYKNASVRPVISLKGDTTILGTGKYNDPFKLPAPDPLLETILLNNGGASYIESKGNPDFTEHSITNEGMFAAADDYGTSYYFRGAVDNNWVRFGKEDGKSIWWRIVRINGDGSIRLLYTGTTPPTSLEKVNMIGAKTSVKSGVFNSSYNKAEYVGFKYTLNVHRGHGTDSTILQFLEGWYEDNLLYYEEYINDQITCNDRHFIGGYTPVGSLPLRTQYSAAYDLLVTNKNPVLACPHKDDSYTANDTTIGNAELNYPIGLLSAHEVTMGGSKSLTANSYYYLYSAQMFWLSSPCMTTLLYASVCTVNAAGGGNDSSVALQQAIRPVISLKSDVRAFGSGSYNKPYIIYD